MKFIKSKAFIITACLVLVTAIAATACILLWPQQEKSNVPTTADKIKVEKEPVTQAPAAVLGGYLTAGVDYDPNGDYKAQIDSLLTAVYDNGGNCVVMPVITEKGAIYNSNRFKGEYKENILKYAVKSAHKKGLLVYAAISPLKSSKGQYDISKESSVNEVTQELSLLCTDSGVDGIILTALEPAADNPSYKSYASSGDTVGYAAYREQTLFSYVRKICSAVRKSGHGICVGVQVPSTELSLAVDWVARNAADFVAVNGLPDTEDYKAVCDNWITQTDGQKPLYFMLDTIRSLAGEVDQSLLISQSKYLVEKGNSGFLTDAVAALTQLNDLSVYLASIKSESYGIRNLAVTSPSSRNFTTYSDTVSFIGSCDPTQPLTLNGQNVERTDTGYFSIDQKLKSGVNTFTFEHKGTTQVFKIEFKNILIRSIYPEKEQFCDGNVNITVSAVARSGSKLWARIGSEVQEMTVGGGATNDSAETFSTYFATFKTPAAQDVPVEMGTFIVTAEKDGKTETKSGGRLVVRAGRVNTDQITSTPADQVYESGYGILVGQGDRFVAEVTVPQTETLDIINPIDERSRPTNAYLPQGTVDYCSETEDVFNNPESGKANKFRNFNYGKRVYSDNNIKIFKAILPETNTITAVDCSNNGRHTILTFDTAWKAPFNVTLSPQTYSAPYKKGARPDYSITSTTYEYLDIEFCYTQSGQGRIELENDPVFSKAEWVRGSKGYVLRLWLREKGSFYGWHAEYNQDNQLVFSFLNPVQIKESTNSYGYSLEGVKIVLDAGHGGIQPGAVGSSKEYTEAVLNLILTRKIQRELENLGATVIMTRTTDVDVTLEERNLITYEEKPDLFISIHRNSSVSSSARGYEDYYFHPFSKALADAVYQTSVNNFTAGRGVQYYPFYVSRVSCCPSILTENGFMSNSADLEMITKDAHNEKLAVSITQGIVNYLASIKND